MKKVVCDKCSNDVKPDNVYELVLKDYQADLCVSCAAEVQEFIEAGVS